MFPGLLGTRGPVCSVLVRGDGALMSVCACGGFPFSRWFGLGAWSVFCFVSCFLFCFLLCPPAFWGALALVCPCFAPEGCPWVSFGGLCGCPWRSATSDLHDVLVLLKARHLPCAPIDAAKLERAILAGTYWHWALAHPFLPSWRAPAPQGRGAPIRWLAQGQERDIW